MSSVKTDIRTGMPLDPVAVREELHRQAKARDMETAAARGLSETPQAQRLRELIFDQMVARIRGLLQTDEALSAMQNLLRRIDLAEAQAEEAARRVMAMEKR